MKLTCQLKELLAFDFMGVEEQEKDIDNAAYNLIFY
jgi:hypothetical protein